MSGNRNSAQTRTGRVLVCGVAKILPVLLPLCSSSSVEARESVYYFHNDHLGTPQAMTNESGAVVWQAEYRPFGEASVDEDPDGDGKAVVNNLRFPGQYFDAETELHYNWHRYYEPETGRYLTPDPIGLMGGRNHLYVYAGNSPVMHFDLKGLDFTNKCKKDLWVRIDDEWKKASPGKTIFGDTDGVCEGPDAKGECRTFKWIDCYDASADCADNGKMNEPRLTYAGNKHTSGRGLKRKLCCAFESTSASAQEEQGGWRGASEFGEKAPGCK